MKKYYSFAGVQLEIRCPDEFAYTEERRLEPFAVPGCPPQAERFTFSFVEELPAPCGALLCAEPAFRVYEAAGAGQTLQAYDRYVGVVHEDPTAGYMVVQTRGREHAVLLRRGAFSGRIGTHTVLNALWAEHLALQAGGVVLHASYIEWQGRAILFTAPSGTGKSTQADLWEKYRGARLVNGDRAVLRRDEASPTGFVACGLPFSGSSKVCRNVTLPVAAIVYLGQAPCTTLQPLRGAQAFRALWEGCSLAAWHREDLALASGLISEAAGRVPVCRLDCTPDETAVTALNNWLEEL